jgi:hypothetical protein
VGDRILESVDQIEILQQLIEISTQTPEQEKPNPNLTALDEEAIVIINQLPDALAIPIAISLPWQQQLYLSDSLNSPDKKVLFYLALRSQSAAQHEQQWQRIFQMLPQLNAESSSYRWVDVAVNSTIPIA